MHDKELEIFLTNKRFRFSKSETLAAIANMKKSGMQSHLFDEVEEEDFILSVKYKTYKRSVRKIIFALLSILFGAFFIILRIDSFGFFLIIFGIFVFTSSLFGILSNRITETQKNYLKN